MEIGTRGNASGAHGKQQSPHPAEIAVNCDGDGLGTVCCADFRENLLKVMFRPAERYSEMPGDIPIRKPFRGHIKHFDLTLCQCAKKMRHGT